MKTLILTFVFLSLIFASKGSTCISLGDGAWDNPSTWSCGSVPTAGDSVVIALGHTVIISTTEILSGTPFVLVVQGTFLFDHAGAKLHLPCGSTIYIEPTGVIVSSGVGTPSHNIKICDMTIWEGSSGALVGPLILVGPVPLAVEYIGGELIEVNGEWDLYWTVASEQDNDYFIISHSNDGISWEEVGIEYSLGNHLEIIEYNYNLGRLVTGKNIIKISQRDKNGQITQLQILVTNLDASVKVYPNPSTNLIPLTLDLTEVKNEALVQIISLEGRIIKTKKYNPLFSNSFMQLETTGLLGGKYIIMITTQDSRISYPLIIQ